MMENEVIENIIKKSQMKIAVSEFNKEERKMPKLNKIPRIAATIILALSVGSGVVFATTTLYEKIWKTPEKIINPTSEITEESKKENISEEDAKNIAINKLKEIGFNTEIVKTNHYKDIDSNKITYRFSTEENYEISINGKTGEFYDIWNNNADIQDQNMTITEDEAIETANKYYELFGFEKGEYEITRVWSNNKNGSGKGPGVKMDITYSKKYGDIYNPYERIHISIESKNKALGMFRVSNIPFDNNEIIITKEEAIQIALDEDKKIETNEIISTKAEKMIVKMNTGAYERINNTEKYYAAMQTPDYPNEERNYYNIDDKIRNAWVVVITYEDNYGGDIGRRYTEGQFSYFVDCTTGEIIGGHVMDATYSS